MFTIWPRNHNCYARSGDALPSPKRTKSAPRKRPASWLNGWPMHSPADASPMSSRTSAHGSRPMWFATPSSRWTCATYSLPVSRRTLFPAFCGLRTVQFIWHKAPARSFRRPNIITENSFPRVIPQQERLCHAWICPDDLHLRASRDRRATENASLPPCFSLRPQRSERWRAALYHSLENFACTRLLLEAAARIEGSNALYRVLDLDNIDALKLLLAQCGNPNESATSDPQRVLGNCVPTSAESPELSRRDGGQLWLAPGMAQSFNPYFFQPPKLICA
jgi:hypothetical protein